MSMNLHKKLIQIHSHVLPQEKQCCDCIAFIENIDSKNSLGYCSTLQEPTMKYDECGAFVRVSLEKSK